MNDSRFPDQFITTVRERSDLISVVSQYVTLKKSGQSYAGLCPFHSEKTASFVVNPVKQIFHCFGCGLGGDVFQFLTKIEGIPFPEAVRKLAMVNGISMPAGASSHHGGAKARLSDQMIGLNEEVAVFFHQNLLKRREGEEARAYLKARGMTLAAIEAFMIGFALPRWDDLLTHFGKKYPLSLLEGAGLISKREASEGFFDRFRNRVLFPIRTQQGIVAGFGGRVLDASQPKYLNTPETAVFTKGKHLFGLDRAKGMGGTLVVVEGYFDAISAHQAGMSNVVATLGTALTQDHLSLIQRLAKKVTLVFDPDEAGVRAALRAAPLFIERGISAEVISLPPGEDPDLFVRKNGKEGFAKKLAEGKSLIDFSIVTLVRAVKSIDDKKKVIEEIFPLINMLKTKVEQSHYLKRLSDELAVSESDVRAEFLKRAQKGKKADPLIDPPAIEKREPLPEDEEIIASLLLQGNLDPSALTGQLILNDFVHPQISRLLSNFWNEEKGEWRNAVGLDAIRGMALFSHLSVRRNDYEDIGRVAQDCIFSMKVKRVRREGDEIQKLLKLAERKGDIPLLMSLQKTFLELKRELGRLTLSR